MYKERPDFGFNKGINEGKNKEKELYMNKFMSGNQRNQEEPYTGFLDFYDVTDVIRNSVAVEPDPDSNLYQVEGIYIKYGRLSRHLTIVNMGPGILFVRISRYNIERRLEVTVEVPIYEGDAKEYDRVYDVKLRSPSANVRYRVTEYKVTSIAGQTFSGSRFRDRRDRSGVIVFQDEFESPTLKFDSLFTGVPGTVTRSNDTAYFGDFSIRVITGPNVGDTATLRYRHTDFHNGKLAAQVHFASASPSFGITIIISHFDGTIRRFAQASIFNDGNLFILRPDGTFALRASNIPIVSSIRAWNIMKLTVDISSFQYVAVVINGTRIDLSDLSLRSANVVSRIHVETLIHASPPVPGAVTAFFDNYIFTDDEILF